MGSFCETGQPGEAFMKTGGKESSFGYIKITATSQSLIKIVKKSNMTINIPCFININ